MKLNRFFPAVLVVCSLFASAGTSAQTPQLTMAGYPAPGAPPTVTVASTGAGPKKALRYVIPAGQKATMEINLKMGMSMNMAGMAMPMDMPGMKMTADAAVTQVDPNGDITYTLAFTGLTIEAAADANPAVAAALQGAAANITSMKGTSTISSRGVTKSAKMEVGDPTMQQMLGQMTSTIENLSNPFPEEAVGVGAKWEVRQAITSGGQTSFTKTEYELMAMDGNTVTLNTKMEQTAPPQSVSNPALPAGTEIALEKLSGTGTGTTKITLNSLVPTVEANSSINTSMVMSMGGATQPVTMDMTMKMTVGPGKVK